MPRISPHKLTGRLKVMGANIAFLVVCYQVLACNLPSAGT